MSLNPVMMEMMSEPHAMTSYMPLLYYSAHDRSVYTPRLLVVELGVNVGHSTISLLSGLSDVKTDTPGRLISCDIEVCSTAERNVAIAKLDRFWTFELIDSVDFAKTFGDSKVHLLFIDTSHEYERTVRELAVWTPKVVPGGRILLHDTSTRQDGVLKPVVDFVAANPSWRFTNIDIHCGLGILDKPTC